MRTQTLTIQDRELSRPSPLCLPVGDCMYLECANPHCRSPFNFRQGAVRRFVRGGAIKHIWLCNRCSSLYAVDFLGNELRLLPMKHSNYESVAA
jgi:hypothetical protein